jgi:hypothetical protein
VSYTPIEEDDRIKRLAVDLVEPLGNVVGDVQRIGRAVVLSQLPLNPLYIADMMVYPSVAASLMKFGLATKNNRQTTIVLIHPEEHYDLEKSNLVGRQSMRVRHLKKMGFRVMEIDYSLAKRLIVMPAKLREYLGQEYDKAHT